MANLTKVVLNNKLTFVVKKPASEFAALNAEKFVECTAPVVVYDKTLSVAEVEKKQRPAYRIEDIKLHLAVAEIAYFTELSEAAGIELVAAGRANN